MEYEGVEESVMSFIEVESCIKSLVKELGNVGIFDENLKFSNDDKDEMCIGGKEFFEGKIVDCKEKLNREL